MVDTGRASLATEPASHQTRQAPPPSGGVGHHIVMDSGLIAPRPSPSNHNSMHEILDVREDFLKFFCISFIDCDVKSLSGYEIQRSLQSQVGKIERLEIEGKNSITIKIATRELSEKIKTLKTVCSKEVTIKHHLRYNFT